MNKSKVTLAGVTAMAALSGLTLSACGGESNSASKVPDLQSSSTATTEPSPSSTLQKVSRGDARTPMATPSATSSSTEATATEKAETPTATPTATETAAPSPTATPTATKKAPAPKPVVRTKRWSATKTLAQPRIVYVKDSSLGKGKAKLLSQGHPGKVKVQYKRTFVNGVPQAAKVVDSDIITSPKATRVAVGSRLYAKKHASVKSHVVRAKAYTPRHAVKKAKTTATRTYASKAVPSTVVRKRSTATPAMANVAMWDKIARCESGGNWSISTGNGYHGGLQFDRQTWLGAGGGVYASTANLATKAQQIAIANKVYAQRGLQPWACGYAASR